MIRTKKDALADAYAYNGTVPARLGPVGSSAYTPQGTAHDWLYTSLEAASRGARTCEMDIGGRPLRLREMNWRESNTARCALTVCKSLLRTDPYADS